jgi:hypothetical protein
MCPQWNSMWGQPPQQPGIQYVMVPVPQDVSPKKQATKIKFPKMPKQPQDVVQSVIAVLEQTDKLKKALKDYEPKKEDEKKKGKTFSALEAAGLFAMSAFVWIPVYIILSAVLTR